MSPNPRGFIGTFYHKKNPVLTIVPDGADGAEGETDHTPRFCTAASIASVPALARFRYIHFLSPYYKNQRQQTLVIPCLSYYNNRQTSIISLYLFSHAEVVELVDTQRSERCGSNPVAGQALSSAPLRKLQVLKVRLASLGD